MHLLPRILLLTLSFYKIHFFPRFIFFFFFFFFPLLHPERDHRRREPPSRRTPKWAKRGRNETLKHKIEKFDVRQFTAVLKHSKVARYSALRSSLYFSFLAVRWLCQHRRMLCFLHARCWNVCRSQTRNVPPQSNTGHYLVFTLVNMTYRFSPLTRMTYRM